MSANGSRWFLDTNILVYAHDATAGEKQHRARLLLQEGWQTGAGCLSIQVLQEFSVTVTRRLSHPVDPETAREIVRNYAKWAVHSPDAEDVLEAIAIHRRHSLSFWNALIVRSATRLGCGAIMTEDLNAGQVIEGVAINNPFA